MRELTGDARLVDEHADELAVLGDVRQDALDGDDLIDAGRQPAGRALKTSAIPPTLTRWSSKYFPKGAMRPLGCEAGSATAWEVISRGRIYRTLSRILYADSWPILR